MSETSTTVPEAPVARQTKASFSAWWVLTVLFVLYVFSFIDRHIITMLVPDIKRSLGLTDLEMGLILGPAFAVFYSIFGLPLGWLADRYPRRLVIFMGCGLFGLATAASSLTTSFLTLFIARALVGIGEASLSPAAYSLMADKFPRNLFATASAIYNTAAKIGTASAYAIGGVVIGLAAGLSFALPGLGELESWRVVFIVVGLPAAILSLLVFTFREPARTSVVKKAGAPADTIVSFVKAEKALLIPMLLGFSLMAVCTFALSAWAPTYIARRFDLSPLQYGPVLAAVSMAAAFTLVFKGGIVDWLYSRGGKDAHIRFYTWLQIGCLPIAVATFLVPNPIIFMICYGILQVVALPTIVFMSAAIQLIVPGNLRGQITAVFFFCLQVIGNSTGPIAVAFLTDYVFRDDAMIGYSMGVVVCVAMPVSLILLRMSLKPLRTAVTAAEDRDRLTEAEPSA